MYTKPDTTENRSTLVNATARHSLRDTLIVSGTAYYRRIHSNTLNGDSNEDSLDQALYQPNAVARGALTATGYTVFPVSTTRARPVSSPG